MIGPFATSLALLGLSGLLIDHHRRVLSATNADRKADEPARRFARSQHRRRMIGSSLIGVVGAFIAFYPVVPREPLWMALYMLALVLGCLAILVCGVVDALAGAKFYRRIALEDRLKQAALAFELEQQYKKSSKPLSDDA